MKDFRLRPRTSPFTGSEISAALWSPISKFLSQILSRLRDKSVGTFSRFPVQFSFLKPRLFTTDTRMMKRNSLMDCFIRSERPTAEVLLLPTTVALVVHTSTAVLVESANHAPGNGASRRGCNRR